MSEKQDKKSYYPLFLDIRGKRCVVVGGGSVALRKVSTLLEYGASVLVISPSVCPELTELTDRQKIQVKLKSFEPEDIKRAFILIAATDKNEVNELVASEARKQKIMINVADKAIESDFILPAILSRGDLTLAVSTAGRSPALSRKLRDHLAKYLGTEYEALTDLVAEVRTEIKVSGISIEDEVWQEALNLDVLTHLLRNGQREQAKSYLMANLTSPDSV